MKTKILEKINQKKIPSNWNKNEILIPKNILEEINKKWFFLYNWIDTKEIKSSVELDFIKKMLYLWPVWLVLSILLFFIFGIWWTILTIAFLSLLIILYIIIISISRTLKASKINYLVITNKYFSINRKIWKIENNSIILDEESIKIWDFFQEWLFLNSNLENEKNSALENITVLVKKWFDFVWEMKSDSKDWFQLKLIITLTYLVFLFVMGILYFAWILAAIFLWIFISYLSQKYLIFKWNKVLLINKYFQELEFYWKNLNDNKNQLNILLSEAKNNNWQDWLLLKINDLIEKINENAVFAMNKNLELIKIIKNSKYSEIFDYNLYHSWLKKELWEPIKWIIFTLENNIFIIKNKIKENLRIIEESKDENLVWHVKISINKLNLKEAELLNHIILLNENLKKLEN